MPREIWNEGRVVGLSAYEIYIKEFLETNPGSQPASEREWLASSLALGASMLVKVPADTGGVARSDYDIEIPFPADSRLCAANTIIGSFFHGDAVVGSDGYWATKVTDYGELISNTSSSSPNNLSVDPVVPKRASLVWTSTEKAALSNYLKIVDGIIIQPGTWANASSQPPQKDLTPDMSKAPTLRLHISESIDEPFWLLLTGFSIRTVVVGESGVDGSVGTDSPEDGDFLGPQCFPWANKVIFSIPPAGIKNVLGSAEYARTVTWGEFGSAQTATVSDSPIIDMSGYNAVASANTIYNEFPSALINYTVSSVNANGSAAVLAVAPRGGHHAYPVLHASYVNAAGQKVMIPLDTVAPGTVKVFEGNVSDQAAAGYYSIPGNHAFIRTPAHNELYQLITNNGLVTPLPIAVSDVTQGTVSGLGGATSYKYTASVKTGDRDIKVLALVDQSGNVLPTTGSARTYTIAADGYLNWDVLQAALGNNGKIDVLGSSMRQFRSQLETVLASGKQYAIALVNGNVVIEEAAALPNFFFSSLACDIMNYGSENVYSDLRIDLLGFYSVTSVVNSFGMLTVGEIGTGKNISGNNWLQAFKIADGSKAEFDTLVTKLSMPYSGASLNVVKLMCSPVTGYKGSSSATVNDCAQNSQYSNQYVAYINLTNGTSSGAVKPGNKYDGILYVRNNCNTQYASSTGVMCSASILNMTYRPSCRRTDGPYWSIS